MKLEILTPEKMLFNGDVDSVTLPGASGAFTVLPNHAPLISSLHQNGKVTYVCGAHRQTLTIGGGFVEVRENRITVCADLQP